MKEIIIEFLRLILKKNGCLLVTKDDQIYFFQGYTYKGDDEKILISDDDNELTIYGVVDMVNCDSNSLQISTSSGIIELRLL